MISCKEYVAIKKEELKNEIKSYRRKPKLCVIQVGNNPASNVYVRNKGRDCEEVGIEFEHVKRDRNITQNTLEAIVDMKSKDKSIDGIIVQLPLPEHLDVNRITNLITPDKDVDGFRRDSYFKPCTPKGIVDWLKFNNYDLVGKDIVVLGRSDIVGKPLVNMLINEGATVTCCNSHTNTFTRLNLTRSSNVVISAVGKAKFLNYHDFIMPVGNKKLDIVVDVGINRDEHGKLCGDVDNEGFTEHLPNAYLTPVPGSIGLNTRLVLLQNTVEAYKMHEGEK